MIDETPHQPSAVALEEAVCLEVARNDIETLLLRKPHAGMDMLTVLGPQIHASQALVRVRAARNANQIIESQSTIRERITNSDARFPGSWTLLLTFLSGLAVH